jgi:predicted HD superfamily hydrolase involved in NAD metabolism
LRGCKIDFESLKIELRKTLSEKRFQHTLGVEQRAIEIGKHFSENPENLRAAALLHDCAKSMNQEEQISYAKEHSIPLSEHDLKAKGIIHAKIGAFIARKNFHISAPEILDAIAFHSTGRAGMTRFEKIIFASDYLDPYRKFQEENDKLLKLIYSNLDKGVLEIVKAKLRYVMEKNESIHPLSIQFYNSLLIPV